MDIMRPHVWRTCGRAAIALSGGIAALTMKITIGGRGLADPVAPLLNIMIAACTLLTAIRLIAPPIAKNRQMIELKLGLQDRILDALTPPQAPRLTLVPPLDDDYRQSEAPTQELPRIVNLR